MKKVVCITIVMLDIEGIYKSFFKVMLYFILLRKKVKDGEKEV